MVIDHIDLNEFALLELFIGDFKLDFLKLLEPWETKPKTFHQMFPALVIDLEEFLSS